MPDDVRGVQKDYPTHETGQFAAKCCDIVDLGQRLSIYPGQPAKLLDKFSIVFRTDSEAEVKEIAVEFTNSLSDKGKLLPFLTAWRGKSYRPDELREGIRFAAMVGVPALLTVEHKDSKANPGRAYAVISSITKLPKSMPAPSIEGYKRSEFWVTKKAQYAEEIEKWAAANAKVQGGRHVDAEDEDQSGEGDDSPLPF